MKRIGLISFFLATTALAIFTSATIRKIDTIQSNTATDITIDPSGDLILTSATANTVPYFDATKKLLSSVVTDIELAYLSGVTSAIQDQLDDKAADADVVKITGDQSIAGVKTFTGQTIASSTTNGFRPCPTMTEVQRDAIVSPVLGDCVTNSDQNALNVFDGSAWTDVGGGAGGTRLSLLIDGSFEKGASEGTCTNCTAASETVNVMEAPKNEKALKMSFSASAGDYTIDATATTEWGGLQLKVSCYIATDQTGVKFCSRSNGADQSCLNVISDGSYREYTIPTVASGTSNGYKVEATTSITGDIYVDECVVEAGSNVIDIAQAEYLGSLKYDAVSSCAWSLSSATFANFSAVAACNNATATGLIKAPLTKIPALVLPAGSQAGTYKFIAQGMFYKVTPTQYAGFRFSDGVNSSNTNNLYLGAQSIGNVIGSITYSSSLASDTTINIQGFSLAGSSVEIYSTPNSGSMNIDVYYYPPKSKIVTQLQEETVETANEFSAEISTAGVVSKENLDWINGDCTISDVSLYTCNWNSNVFTQAPNCVVNVTSTSQPVIADKENAPTASSGSFRVSNASTGTKITRGFTLICQKQGADYNKSRMIVGQFEQIKTTELCQVEAYSNDGEAISADTEDIPFKTVDAGKDPCSLWSNVGNTGNNTKDAFTARMDGYIILNAYVSSGTGIAPFYTIYKNGIFANINCGYNGSNAFTTMTCLVPVSTGDIVTLRNTQNITLIASVNHKITITELPDIAGIVKNLNEGGGFLQAPNTGNIKTCYYAFGGAGSLTSPTVCSSSPCTEYYDSCGTASPPTRSGTGNYLNLTWASGTWKANTFIYCTAEGQRANIGSSTVCDPRGLTVLASDSNGGYYTSPYCVTTDPLAIDAVVRVKCEGEAP